jgi:hypothetical protein
VACFFLGRSGLRRERCGWKEFITETRSATYPVSQGKTTIATFAVPAITTPAGRRCAAIGVVRDP